MDITFRSALIVSISIHLAGLYPAGSVIRKIEMDVKKPLTVDYVVIKRPEKMVPVKQEEESKAIETPRAELKKETVALPTPTQLQQQLIGKSRESAQDATAQETQIRKSKDYIAYDQLIREKIRRRLKENYTDYSGEGHVRLIFVLDCRGALVSQGIDDANSVSDTTLREIATISLKEAAPFPPFPKGLSATKIPFDLTVSFKKR